MCAFASAGAAQGLSAWVDANAAHSRPPAGTTADAASYGLLGVRVRAEALRSTVELAASTGRGAAEGSGGWLSGVDFTYSTTSFLGNKNFSINWWAVATGRKGLRRRAEES